MTYSTTGNMYAKPVMVFIRSERSGRSRPPLQKCCKAAPLKKSREASATVVPNQGGFDEVVSRVRWTLSDILTYRRCRRLKKKKKRSKAYTVVQMVKVQNIIQPKGSKTKKTSQRC